MGFKTVDIVTGCGLGGEVILRKGLEGVSFTGKEEDW